MVKLGGINCGWSSSDHSDYLRIRTKHKHKVTTIAFIEEIQGVIPDRDDEAIKSHNQSYEAYLQLSEYKKTLL